jgi:hypothetical protein
VTPVSDDALWLWGRLRDFERHGLLDQDPRAVLETVLETMTPSSGAAGASSGSVSPSVRSASRSF